MSFLYIGIRKVVVAIFAITTFVTIVVVSILEITTLLLFMFYQQVINFDSILEITKTFFDTVIQMIFCF